MRSTLIPTILLLLVACTHSDGPTSSSAPAVQDEAGPVAEPETVTEPETLADGDAGPTAESPAAPEEATPPPESPPTNTDEATPDDDVLGTIHGIQHRLPPDETEVGSPPSPIRVALYLAPGVGMDAHVGTLELLREARGYIPTVVTPTDVRGGALEGMQVVVFTGGRGSIQGEALQEEGRQIVRDFVAAGGGYIGVCAGAYLALQGELEYHKIAIVAGRNFSGDAWRRGLATTVVEEVGGEGIHRIFYANGPIFAPVTHPVLPPYIPLALYRSDVYRAAYGTSAGEMPGTPAILAAVYGRGRIVLFSPNPVLSAEGEAPIPEMMLQAVRWVATPGPVPASLRFCDVFR
jgi:hypothetical protein